MADFSLSFSDLVLVDGFLEAVTAENKKVFEAILFMNGLDVTKGYEIVPCEHRNLQNKVFHGPRVEGWERIDKEWISTGAASLEAIIESTRDKSLRFDLRVMSSQRTQERVFD